MAEYFDLGDYEAPTYITAESVLGQLDDLLIFRYYLGEFKLGTTMKSPFRKDSNPSFSVILNTNWLKLMWKDFGTSEVGDCFSLVAKLNGISYGQAVEKVACDFGLVKGCVIVTKKQILEAKSFKEEFQKREYLIQVDIRNMNKEELDYWGRYNINKQELRNNYIYAINKLWINKKPCSLNVSLLHFAYYFPETDKWKIYTPYSKDWKWFGNVSAFQMEGIDELKDKEKKADSVIITKSRKDRIILSKLYSDVCSCQNEAEQAIPRYMDSWFDEQYKNKFCWFDSDEPGKTANRKLNYRGYKWINTPNDLWEQKGLKDPGDIILNMGWEKGSEILNNELKKKGLII